MPDERGELREINYRQLLPWIDVFRGFRIAMDPWKLLLASAAIVAMFIGWRILAQVFGSSEEPKLSQYNYETQAGESPEKAKERASADYHKDKFLYDTTNAYKIWPANRQRGLNPYAIVKANAGEVATGNFWKDQVPVLMEPLWCFLEPIAILFNPRAGFLACTFAVLGLLWTLAVWAVFGGAITRIAAVQLARKEKIGLGEAFRFATGKFVSFFSAPLLPLAGILVVVVFMFIGGLFLHIPWLGDFLASVLWFLALTGGLVMTVILLGFVGWPLMYATISTEGSDSFDAISRSYSYVYQRPWYYVFSVVAALLYGLVLIFFVVFVTSLMVYLAKWGVSSAMLDYRDYRLSKLFVYAPTSYDWNALLLQNVPTPEKYTGSTASLLLNEMSSESPYNMSWAQKFGAGIVGFWLHMVFLMMLGFAYSYFWSASTLIYFLMRKKVDDTEMDEVYLEEEEDDAYGVPAASPPAAEKTPGGPTTLPLVEPPPAAEPPQTEVPPPAATPAPPATGDGNPTPNQ